MTESPRSPAALSESELDAALVDLGKRIAYPATPDLAAGVRDDLARLPAPAVPPTPIWPGRRFWLVAATVVLLVLGALTVFPEARRAVADRFGLSGVEIRWVEGDPRVDSAPVGATLTLGQLMTLDEARDIVEFPIFVPALGPFADPPEVYVSGSGRMAMVSLVYPERPDLPAAEFPSVGALLTQFPGETDRQLVFKGLGDDLRSGETTIEAVTVGDEAGFWIAGAPHGVFLACLDDGQCREERYRLAGNVLLWERDGETFRLESALPLEKALAIAESLQ